MAYNPGMFRLTREVRFAVNAAPDDQLRGTPANSFGGYPSLTGFGQYFGLSITLSGDLRPDSAYLRNIKDVDDAVRRIGIPLVREHVLGSLRGGGSTGTSAGGLSEVSGDGAGLRGAPEGEAGAECRRPSGLVRHLARALRDAWPGATFEALTLSLSPFLSMSARAEESPMLRLSQKFEFSASHRLFNRDCSEEENRRLFGKCSNPNGHGHNYELQVTLAGGPDPIDGVLANLPDFERIVASAVIDRFDHKNLNVDVPEFAELIPSVENIARVIYRLLKPRFDDAGAALAAVTVWETPKTWCEYSE